MENFREGWAILPFAGGFAKPHYWRRIELSSRYQAICGLQGSVASREDLVARGMSHARGIKPLEPGVFMVDRCKHCSRKHQRRAPQL
jgi:hypothetical protein